MVTVMVIIIVIVTVTDDHGHGHGHGYDQLRSVHGCCVETMRKKSEAAALNNDNVACDVPCWSVWRPTDTFCPVENHGCFNSRCLFCKLIKLKRSCAKVPLQT